MEITAITRARASPPMQISSSTPRNYGIPARARARAISGAEGWRKGAGPNAARNAIEVTREGGIALISKFVERPTTVLHLAISVNPSITISIRY